jgi:hypothetical protein
LVLLGLLSLLFAAVSYLKKWLKQPDATVGTGFTLSDLREMRRKGQISDEEFERAKGKIVAAAQRAITRDAAAKQPVNRRAPGFDVVSSRPPGPRGK